MRRSEVLPKRQRPSHACLLPFPQIVRDPRLGNPQRESALPQAGNITEIGARWPEDPWRCKNFPPADIACRGSGKLLVNESALERPQALRDWSGKPLIVRSAFRSPEHNRAVGGAKRSMHMEGIAFDIAMSNHDPTAFEATAHEAGFLGFGFYSALDFMHGDVGPKREMGRTALST